MLVQGGDMLTKSKRKRVNLFSQVFSLAMYTRPWISDMNTNTIPLDFSRRLGNLQEEPATLASPLTPLRGILCRV
jgi:hypothetical protein